MKRPPRPPQQTVFAEGRGLHMIWVGILMAGIALSLQGWAIRNDMPWQTMVFNFLCLSQMGHVLAIRSEKESFFRIGLFSNKLLIGSVIMTFLLQAMITYVPFFQTVFKTEALDLKEFIMVGVASALIFVAVEIEKLVRRKKISI
jgi:Ca2+-transporting ATPase